MSSYVDGQGAKAYTDNRHGLDGAVLLDPYFVPHIQDRVPGMKVIDIGAGIAPWTIYAAEAGAAAVRGFDNSEQMLSQAQAAVAKQSAEVKDRIEIQYGTVQELPVEDESFDVAFSINVGCAIPSTILTKHFLEMRRTLVSGGFAIVTAPASLETVFTTFGDEDGKIADFNEALSHAKDREAVQQVVGSNTDILRATMLNDWGQFRLARPKEMRLGEHVLRKIPGLVVPNFAHTEAEYERALTDAGFEIREIDKPTLSDTQAAQALGLGPQYAEHNPFVTYLAQAA